MWRDIYIWIYYYYNNVHPVYDAAARLAYSCYKKCGLYLSLPSSPRPTAFNRVEKIPLVCRKPGLSGSALRSELKIPSENRAILIAFSEASLPKKAILKIEKIKKTTFIIPAPLELRLKNGIFVPEKQASFHTLVSAADIIITKPGYGIISDAIASKKPLVTTERGDFPEVPYLDRLMQETVGQTKITMKKFDKGLWKKVLKKAALPDFEYPVNGTTIASKRLLKYFTLHTL